MTKYANNVATTHKIVATVNVRTYDVWGNAEDGYDVNDTRDQGSQEVVLTMELMGVPTVPESLSSNADSIVVVYVISDDQLRELLSINAGVEIDVDGDDRHYYVNLAEDGYPVGEVHIESWRAFDESKDSE